MKLRFLNSCLWGVSVALSWTWGLGLFFSVQMAVQFGFGGFLAFAIPNAIGLMGFGILTQKIANKSESSLEFEKHFHRTVGNLRWVFLLYQIVAIALTFFALFKYVAIPLNINVMMVALLVLGAGLLLGEQFTIEHLKWSHLAMAAVILLSILLIGWGGASYFIKVGEPPRPPFNGKEPVLSWEFAGYFIPILAGFLLGPWLDIQQWQRAIQLHREKSSIAWAYVVGGGIFFLILLFHGTLALSIWGEGLRLGISEQLAANAADGLFHAKDSIVRFLFLVGVETPYLFRMMYLIFIVLCIISTLDSGYVALKWFQAEAVSKSESVLMSIIPKGMLNSPMPPFFLTVLIALLALPLKFELEYFMSFYAAFNIGYSMVFLFRTVFEPRFTALTQTTMASLAFFSLGVFGLGYFQGYPWMMMAGSVLPLAHAIVVVATRKSVEEIQRSGVIERFAESKLGEAVSKQVTDVVDKLRMKEGAPDGTDKPPMVESTADMAPGVAHSTGLVRGGASSWFEGKWFVHNHTPTYQDTNSVGNVYFAQYAMWVGKTRELFFQAALPKFDLATTQYFILTRAYEHKFLRETREFEPVQIWLRIQSFNRKFVTLEHKVVDSAQSVLGKGTQVLMFVNRNGYKLIDIPQECLTAFLPYC